MSSESRHTWISAQEVCDMLGIDRTTLYRRVYKQRSIPAYVPPGSSSGRCADGTRKRTRLRFKLEEIQAMMKQAIPDSERSIKRKQRIHSNVSQI